MVATTAPASAETYLATLDTIIEGVIAPAASETDRAGAFPQEALDALGQAGLLGLVNAPAVGGLGMGHRAATQVVERIAGACASTAMIVCMHYAAAAVIEAYGNEEDRREVASGRALATLAFSEAGSRSHFWSPVSTATAHNGGVRLDAHKSWVTAAGHAALYVWSSLPVAAEGASTIWLVPATAPGLRIAGPFDGLGLRGNASSPMTAEAAALPLGAMLGADGQGFEIMMSIVLPYFQLMSAGMCLGTMEAATAKTAAHAGATTFTEMSQSLADLPTIRAYIARMRIKSDMTRALLDDTCSALESGRADTMLRVLESKAAAGEMATEVTELAMRVCGGAAFRKEVGVERHFRDARAATVMAPTTDVLYDFIGKAACGLPLF